jgi:hypothetical protein
VRFAYAEGEQVRLKARLHQALGAEAVDLAVKEFGEGAEELGAILFERR